MFDEEAERPSVFTAAERRELKRLAGEETSLVSIITWMWEETHRREEGKEPRSIPSFPLVVFSTPLGLVELREVRS